MLDRIIALALGNRLIVVVLAIAIAIAGGVATLRAPIDVLPDLDRPVVTVITEAHGMSAEDVEQLVTWPIEQVLNGASGVFRVRSSSTPDLSVVQAEFEWDADVYRARQVVLEKLQLVDSLPGIAPAMAPVSSIMGQVLLVGFKSRDGETSGADLRRIVDRDLRPRIMALPGVAAVATTGARATELQVVADADRMRAFGVTLPEVARAIRAANVTQVGSPMPRGEKAPYVAIAGRLDGAAELRQAVVRADAPRPVRVDDVAEGEFGPSLIGIGDAGIDGEAGVVLVVTKQPGIDTVALTDAVLAELDELSTALPADVEVVDDLFRQADFIHRAIDNVLAAVRDGAILVVIVLFLFLLNIRTTFITLTALPLSVAITALVFTAFGVTINTMTLGGLAVAIGTLVDDAIVDVENVFRRLFENQRSPSPRSRLAVVYDASREVRRPVTYGTLLVTVVYLPLFFLSGIEGRLFLPIGLAYIVSVFASLLVALTLTPVLCALLLGCQRREAGDEYGGRAVALLRRAAGATARASLAQPAAIGAVVLAACLGAAVVLATRGTTFLPAFNEGSAQVNLMLPPGASLETASAFGRRLEGLLMEVDGIAHVARRTGRAEGDEHAMPVSVTEAVVSFDPESTRSREEILDDIRDRVAERFPGVASETEQPLAHLLSHLLSGVTAQVAIKVFGPDLAALRDIAARIEGAVEPIEGVRDLYVEPLVLVDQVQVLPRRESLARLGITVEELSETIGLAMGGEPVSRLREGRITYPIRLLLDPADRADLAALGALYLRSAADEIVRVADVAELRIGGVANELRRENGQRRIVVQHNVSGRALGDVVADVELALQPIRAELASQGGGYTIRLEGQFAAQQDATRIILGLSLVSLAAMLLILQLHFRSIRLATLVLASRPVAFLGAVAAIVLTGQDLSVATMVGMIALFGMATRNAILLVDHAINLLREFPGIAPAEAIVRAARERVVPVMMTALTSGIGLVPLALAADQPGRELLYPVATVIIGGLVTSTVLDFLLTPGLLDVFGKRELERLAAAEDEGFDPRVAP